MFVLHTSIRAHDRYKLALIFLSCPHPPTHTHTPRLPFQAETNLIETRFFLPLLSVHTTHFNRLCCIANILCALCFEIRHLQPTRWGLILKFWSPLHLLTWKLPCYYGGVVEDTTVGVAPIPSPPCLFIDCHEDHTTTNVSHEAITQLQLKTKFQVKLKKKASASSAVRALPRFRPLDCRRRCIRGEITLFHPGTGMGTPFTVFLNRTDKDECPEKNRIHVERVSTREARTDSTSFWTTLKSFAFYGAVAAKRTFFQKGHTSSEKECRWSRGLRGGKSRASVVGILVVWCVVNKVGRFFDKSHPFVDFLVKSR